MARKKDKSSLEALEKSIADLLDKASESEDISLRLSVIDRAIKLEALKAKLSQDDWGSEFLGEPDD
jgi:hypothetical protein